MSADIKYVVIKMEDWEAEFLGDLSQEEVEAVESFIVRDATVIRGQDVFAGPALHTYANMIGLAVSLVSDPETQERLQRIADLFHERAVEADSLVHKKLPD